MAPTSSFTKDNGNLRVGPADTKIVAGTSRSVDSGYGWVILFAAFMCNFIVGGVCFSFGIFYVEFLDYYQASKARTSWVGSMLNGTHLFIGPVAAALANKFGCRVVTMAGSAIAAGAFILSTFSPTINILIFTYGALAGVGLGLMYLPAIVMVGFYFEKRRALATGVAVCGSGIGCFVFAPMCERLIATYNWQGTVWIVAGLILNGVVMGALFRPLETHQPNIDNLKTKTPIISKTEVRDFESQRHPPEYKITNNQNDIFTHSMYNLSSEGYEIKHGSNILLSRSLDDISRANNLDIINIRHTEQTSPLCNQDLSFNGVVLHDPEYKCDEMTQMWSMPEIPEETTDRTSSRSHPCLTWSRSMVNTVLTIVDFSLLKNPVFCVYGMSCFLCMTGFFVPFIYLPDNAVHKGFSLEKAAFLVSIMGIANTIGRVIAGLVSDQPWANCLFINNTALVIGGVTTILCPFYNNYGLLVTYSFIFGTSIATFVSLRSVIMVQLLGLEKLTNSFGLVTMCQGLAAFIGAPIAGALIDITGTYNMTFYMAGLALTVAGTICFPLQRIATWWKRKECSRLQIQTFVILPTEVVTDTTV